MIDRDALRRAIVAQIWTPDLRAELVDRVVELCEGGGAILSEFNDTARRALYAYHLYQETNHARGIPAPWVSIAAWLKRKYEIDGRPWTPPAAALEPRPTAQPAQEPQPTQPAQETKDAQDAQTHAEEPIWVTYRNQDGQDCSIQTTILTRAQADWLTSELACDGKRRTYREMRQIIADFADGIAPPIDHDPRLSRKLTFEELEALSDKPFTEPFNFQLAARAA